MGYSMEHSIDINYFVGCRILLDLRVGVKADFHSLCEGTGNTIIALKLLLSQQLSFLVLFEAVFAILAKQGIHQVKLSYSSLELQFVQLYKR